MTSMPVWTSTVRQALRCALTAEPWPASFLDIGCGKGKALLATVAKQLSRRPCTVVYVNPVEPEAFISRGFHVTHQRISWHPVATCTVLTSPRLSS